MSTQLGKRVVNLDEILEQYEAQEGEVQHIIGKTGMGKTYEGTRRALGYLYSGYSVYTTWRLNLPDYYDEREHFWPVFWKLVFFKKGFVRFPLKKNWHYLDLDSFQDTDGIIDVKKLSDYIAALTDSIVFLDEGQDVFDSHKKATASARQSITRTRHMHKTLIIISQRAQAVDVTARANVTYFYRCEKLHIFFWTRFKVYRTDEVDEANSHPIWARHDSTGRVVWKAPLWHSGWAKKWIYDSYDSWYMRQSMIRSQDLHLDAFTLTFGDKVKALRNTLRFRHKKELSTDT